jgi:hypothetical protein
VSDSCGDGERRGAIEGCPESPDGRADTTRYSRIDTHKPVSSIVTGFIGSCRIVVPVVVAEVLRLVFFGFRSPSV